MRGVREVAGELPVRPFVALGAGSHDVLVGERGRRIRRRQDRVGPVAVVALGASLGAEERGLAVDRLEEGLGLVLVAASALARHLQPEVRLVGAADLVGGVAVLAGGEIGLHPFSPGPVDALLELLLDPVVATPAGRRDVVVVHGGLGIRRRQFQVGRVAVHAGRRDEKSTRLEPLPVDAHEVALDHGDVGVEPLGGLPPFLVAASAERGDVPREGRGDGNLVGEDRVLVVAVQTASGASGSPAAAPTP